jgi:hypothetical protein
VGDPSPNSKGEAKVSRQHNRGISEPTYEQGTASVATELQSLNATKMDKQKQHLHHLVRELRSWLYEVEQRGIPKFGETGYRLRKFRESLADHFETCSHQGLEQPLSLECRRLLGRLEDLIVRLEMPDPPFQSWQELASSLVDFIDDLSLFESKLEPYPRL